MLKVLLAPWRKRGKILPLWNSTVHSTSNSEFTNMSMPRGASKSRGSRTEKKIKANKGLGLSVKPRSLGSQKSLLDVDIDVVYCSLERWQLPRCCSVCGILAFLFPFIHMLLKKVKL